MRNNNQIEQFVMIIEESNPAILFVQLDSFEHFKSRFWPGDCGAAHDLGFRLLPFKIFFKDGDFLCVFIFGVFVNREFPIRVNEPEFGVIDNHMAIKLEPIFGEYRLDMIRHAHIC